MIDDYGKQLLKSGIIDAKAGDHQSARRYLDRAVYISSDHDVLAEAWFWMSEVLDDPSEKRRHSRIAWHTTSSMPGRAAHWRSWMAG